jgi:8-oxo-dGTP pyrophosphatase MutT (NUDIX family)
MNEITNSSIPTAGVAAFTKDLQQVLLVKHTKNAAHQTGVYGLPAGHIDEGETAIIAAAREFEEETGIILHSTDTLVSTGEIYTAAIETKKGLKRFTMEIFALFLEDHMNAKVTEEGEPELVLLSNLDSLTLLPNVQTAIIDAVATLQTN